MKKIGFLSFGTGHQHRTLTYAQRRMRSESFLWTDLPLIAASPRRLVNAALRRKRLTVANEPRAAEMRCQNNWPVGSIRLLDSLRSKS